MRSTWTFLLAMSAAGCAMTGANEACTGDAGACEASAQSEALTSRLPGGGGGGSTGVTCTACTDQYWECLEDTGTDPVDRELCQWELGVCYHHCDGPIIAAHL